MVACLRHQWSQAPHAWSVPKKAIASPVVVKPSSIVKVHPRARSKRSGDLMDVLIPIANEHRPLPPHAELSAAIGLSAATMTMALRRLESDGRIKLIYAGNAISAVRIVESGAQTAHKLTGKPGRYKPMLCRALKTLTGSNE